jgi:hypothetical protein
MRTFVQTYSGHKLIGCRRWEFNAEGEVYEEICGSELSCARERPLLG